MAFEGIRRIAKGESNIDFMGRKRVWAAVSGGVILISLIGLLVVQLNLGLEFEGGTSFTVPLEREVTVAQVEKALEPIGVGEPTVQISRDQTGKRAALVRTEPLDQDTQGRALLALQKMAGIDSTDDINLTSVGPTWGRQISNKALRSLIVFLVLVVIYISIRFEPKMAAAAVAAVFHDLIATAGIYALTGLEVTPATVIALLTLLGYSLYDTVVVFDRVRENAATMAVRSSSSYSDMVNRSVNEVLMRSINTSLSSLLPVGGLLFVGVLLLGAGTLKDLALALFIGTAVSTYSSIFVASPILAWWKEREPRYRQMRARAPARAAGAPAAVAVAAGTAGSVPSGRGEGGTEDAEGRTREPIRASGPITARPPRQRRGKRGGKRRR